MDWLRRGSSVDRASFKMSRVSVVGLNPERDMSSLNLLTVSFEQLVDLTEYLSIFTTVLMFTWVMLGS